MCGIFGFVGFIEKTKAQFCIDTIKHRGPDGRGLWQTDEITLAHRRLAVIDLSKNAAQPMSYLNRYWITYNGEIYNFLEIKSVLIAKGYTFATDSDTEVILAAYAAWGNDCLLKFNGMWAFAIWDNQTKTLFLSRDRFGKKPFYYSFINGCLAFASEMKALFPLLPQVDPAENIQSFFNDPYSYEATSQCIIKGISRFPAAHYAILKQDRLTMHCYWNTEDHLVDVPQKYEQQVDQFRDLFFDSCKLRMRSDVPIGTALSGGMDSSAVISALAHIGRHNPTQRMSKDWQHAFVARFPDSPVDETFYAQKVVDNLNISADFIDITPQNSISKLGEYIYLFEEICDTSPIPMIETYKKLREAGIIVSIDGHGADELLAGYGNSLLYAFLDCGPAYFSIRNIISAHNGLDEKGQQHNISSKACLKSYFDTIRSHTKLSPFETFKYILRQCVKNQSNSLGIDATQHFNRHLYKLFHQTVLPTLLRNYDHYAMINGVEIRMPFVDHRIVSILFSIPWHSKIRNGFTKSILRDAMRPYLPPEVVNRKSKIGFTTPFLEWLRKDWREYFSDLIHSREFENSELIDPVKTRSIVENALQSQSSGYDETTRVWFSIMPFLWEKNVVQDYKRFQHNLAVSQP